MSPIRPENRELYLPTWHALSWWVRFARAGGRCEFTDHAKGERCEARHGVPHPITGSDVVLTTAHLDHDPTNSTTSNLRAGCQRCHLLYDSAHHAETRRNVPGQLVMHAGEPDHLHASRGPIRSRSGRRQANRRSGLVGYRVSDLVHTPQSMICDPEGIGAVHNHVGSGEDIELVDMVTRETILRGTVGSRAHGTALDDVDDRDEMGVYVPSPIIALGLSEVEHYIYRTRANGERSQPGDLDLSLYGLRKFVMLAVKGNPSVLQLLFLPTYAVKTDVGEALIQMRDFFITQRTGRAFLGYMNEQMRRLKGEIGQKDVKRPELVEAHGYDTKYAGHAIRLGLQGDALCRDGEIPMPLPEAQAADVIAIRRGEWPLDDVVRFASVIENSLQHQVTKLPAVTRTRVIEHRMLEIYSKQWGVL